ncbi:hypothetical protein WAI453_000114 [Rhynchosporium graminicola]
MVTGKPELYSEVVVGSICFANNIYLPIESSSCCTMVLHRALLARPLLPIRTLQLDDFSCFHVSFLAAKMPSGEFGQRLQK